MQGILGKKIGMTQVFTKDGKLVPVTVIEVEPNVVTQIKTEEKDGYNAIQLGAITIKEKSSNKAKVGHTSKANTSPKRFLREIRGVNVSDYTLGQVIDASVFVSGEMVDVSGVSKGKGFQGVIKRHNQTRGPMGHGSQYHRGVGSMGTLLPMHVLKGKKLPGHMGNVTTTIQNLEVVAVDLENNVILIKGNVPGPKKSLVIVKTAVKNAGKINEAFELVSYEEEIVQEEEVTTEEATEVLEETEAATEEAEETVEENPDTEENVE
jgi:50S ribosomal protein L3, bacterial